LVTLTSDRRLSRGFSHFPYLRHIVAARPAGTVRRVRTNMNVKIDRTDEQVINDCVFVGHAGFLSNS